LIFDFAQLCDGHAARSGRRRCHEIIGALKPLGCRCKTASSWWMRWGRMAAV